MVDRIFCCACGCSLVVTAVVVMAFKHLVVAVTTEKLVVIKLGSTVAMAAATNFCTCACVGAADVAVVRSTIAVVAAATAAVQATTTSTSLTL